MMKFWIRTKAFVLIGLIIFTTSTSFSATNSTVQKIENGISFILGLPQLPLVHDPDRKVAITEIPLTEQTVNIFKRLVIGTFGNESSFILKPYLGAAAACDVEGKIVYMNPHFEKSLRTVTPADKVDDVIALIFAHEIGHYFYEANVQYGLSKKSPLGNPNYIGASPAISPQQINLMHGEVDLFGMVIMNRAGYKVELAPEALNFIELALHKMLPGLGIGDLDDKKERLLMMRSYFE